MAKVNTKDFSSSRPVLSPDMFPRHDIIPFTIKSVERRSFKGEEDGEKEKTRLMLISEEHGENVIWLNITSIRALIARLGDDDDNWIGETIPLVKIRTTDVQTKQPVTKLWVAGSDDDDAWDEVGGKKRRAPAGRRVASQEEMPLKSRGKRGAKRGRKAAK